MLYEPGRGTRRGRCMRGICTRFPKAERGVEGAKRKEKSLVSEPHRSGFQVAAAGDRDGQDPRALARHEEMDLELLS